MPSSQPENVGAFRVLHEKGRLLILPNAWDAASARLMEDCGAAAIATSSAAVAWAHGYPDGEAIPFDVFFAAVKEITRVVRVPVSVDSEAGYSSDPETVAELASKLVDQGVTGVNLEDGTAPPELLARKIAAIRKALAARGADIFINARTDTYLKSLVPADKAVSESIARGNRYRDAGADGLFVPAVVDLPAMRQISDSVALPLNVLTWSGLPAIAELKSAGVRRVSAGAATARAALGAARRAAVQLLEEGRYDALFAEADGCPNMNGLLTPR